MADWSNSRSHDATNIHHVSQDVGRFCTYFADPATSRAWNRVMSPSLISDITSVSGGSAPRGARQRPSAVRHAAFGGRSYIRWEVGVHQDLRKLEFLALSDLVGRRNRLRKRCMSPNQMAGRAVDYVKCATLHTTWTNNLIYLWMGRTGMKYRCEPSDRSAVRATIPSPDRVKKEGRCGRGSR